MLLILMAAAGCAQNSAPADDDGDEASQNLVEAEPGVFVPENRALVRGTVTDDAGRDLKGVRVSLLSTDFFGDTDAQGRFEFRNVTPGPYRLSAVLAGFQPYHEDLDLAPGNVTTLVIHLLPDVSRGAGYRPHVHDYWAGRTQVVMFDGDLDLSVRRSLRGGQSQAEPYYRALSMAYYPNYNGTFIQIPILAHGDGSPNLVYQGADRVDVRFDWTATGTTRSTLGLMYHAPTQGQTFLAPKATGQTWTIPVNDSKADRGHQAFTLWKFYLYYPDGAGAASSGRYVPAATLGSVHIKIEVFRGHDPPLEPAHTDFWGNSTSLLLREASLRHRYPQTPTPRENWEMLLPTNKIVPPGTARLVFNFTFATTHPADAALKPNGYKLMWRSADQNPMTVQWSEYHSTAPAQSGPGWKRYDVRVEPHQADAFYQKASNWGFSPVEPGKEQDPDDWGTNTDSRAFTLEVWAHRDPAWVLE